MEKRTTPDFIYLIGNKVMNYKNASGIALIMLLLCASCNSQKNQGQPESADTAVADSTEAKEEIVGIVNELYAAAAQNVPDIDGRFACHSWRDMVAAVNEKDAHVEEIGFFNDDYWTMMQDSNPEDLEARDILFEQLDVQKGTATVSFILYSSVQTIHQKFAFCREDGEWRVHDIVRFYNDADGKETSFSLMKSMQDYLNESEGEMPELTFANMAGIYDSFNEEGGNESRIGLNEDGTATWNMIGSLNFTEFTYTINGNTICLTPKDANSEDDCYEYDFNARALKNEQGAVYYRQVME